MIHKELFIAKFSFFISTHIVFKKITFIIKIGTKKSFKRMARRIFILQKAAQKKTE